MDPAPNVPATMETVGAASTVAQVAAIYLAQAKLDVSPRTYETREWHVRLFANLYGAISLAALKPFHVTQFLNHYAANFRSEWTVRGVLVSIRRLFNWLVEMDLIDKSPFARFRRRGKVLTRRKPMRDEDFQALLRFSSPAWRRLLIFLKLTGCRPGEAAKMRWADVQFDKACVILFEHKTASSTGKPRTIPLVPTVARMLAWMKARRQVSTVGLLEQLLRHGPVKGIGVARFMAHYGISDRGVARARETLGVIRERVPGRRGHYTYRLPDDHVATGTEPEEDAHVFKTCLGNPLTRSSMACYVRRVRRRAGLSGDVTLYTLRHRFCFQGVRNRVHPKLLSLMVGHANCRMIEHYIDADGLADDVQAAASQAVYGTAAPPAYPELPAGGPAATSEHLPSRYGNARARPHLKPDLANVPLPVVALSDPGELSVQQMLRVLMSRVPAPRPPTSSAEKVNPTHERAYAAVAWAEREAGAPLTDAAAFAFLQSRPDRPSALPPSFGTFQRYVSAARLYHDTRKRIMPAARPASRKDGAA
jgi:integrase